MVNWLDKKEISRKATEKGLVISAAALDRVVELNLDYESLFSKAKEVGEWFISPEYIEGAVSTAKSDVCEETEGLTEGDTRAGSASTSARPTACDISSKLVIYDDGDVSGKSTCAGSIEDFINYFNVRYRNIRGLIMDRTEYAGATNIEVIRRNKTRDRVRIVCMVKDKRSSPKGHKFIEVEDSTGS
jgi:DNA polymerase II small subunit/DNA polymerase delta subunit B